MGKMAESPGKDPASVHKIENMITNDAGNALGYLTIGRLTLGKEKKQGKGQPLQ